MQVTLHLQAQNLPDSETFGIPDPYFQVFLGEELLHTSEVGKDTNELVQWEPAVFEIPMANAIFQKVTVRILDKDTFSNDDMLVEFEIRWPFRKRVYSVGDTGIKIAVLNDDGEVPDEEQEADVPGESFMDKLKLGKKLLEFFV